MFDMDSNYFGPVIPKKFRKLYKRAIKCENCVSINRSKATSL